MTEPRRRRWFVDIWDDDDPAVRRLRDAIASRPVDAPGAPEPSKVAPDTTQAAEPAAEESQRRRGRIQQLVARLRAGDLSARQALEDLLR